MLNDIVQRSRGGKLYKENWTFRKSQTTQRAVTEIINVVVLSVFVMYNALLKSENIELKMGVH